MYTVRYNCYHVVSCIFGNLILDLVGPGWVQARARVRGGADGTEEIQDLSMTELGIEDTSGNRISRGSSPSETQGCDSCIKGSLRSSSGGSTSEGSSGRAGSTRNQGYYRGVALEVPIYASGGSSHFPLPPDKAMLLHSPRNHTDHRIRAAGAGQTTSPMLVPTHTRVRVPIGNVLGSGALYAQCKPNKGSRGMVRHRLLLNHSA